MRKITLVATFGILMALMVGHASASGLAADLNKNGDLEKVVQGPLKVAYVATDLDKNGEVDLIRTRGVPMLLCNLDVDSAPEAVVQDARLTEAYAVMHLGSGNPAVVFVRGEVVHCVGTTPDSAILLVRDPSYTGAADIDGDGEVDVIWAEPTAPGPGQLDLSDSPARQSPRLGGSAVSR
jgi:hypothetical protein